MKAARVTESCILGADIVDLVLPPEDSRHQALPALHPSTSAVDRDREILLTALLLELETSPNYCPGNSA